MFLRVKRHVLVLLALLAVACGGGAPVAQDVPPERIIALAPSVSELLFELGLGDRVVGVGDYSTWPPEAATKPRLGGLFNPRLEQIATLEPDLAVLLESEAALAEHLEQLGVPVLMVRSDSLDDVEDAINRISSRCGVPAAGERLMDDWRARLEPAPVGGIPSVLVTVGRPPGSLGGMLVAGPNTFVDELLERLGATNALADAPISYPEIGLEEVLLRQPTVIIELQPETLSAERRESLVKEWSVLPELPAVANGCIEVIEGDYVLLPGPRLPLLYEQMHEALFSCQAR